MGGVPVVLGSALLAATLFVVGIVDAQTLYKSDDGTGIHIFYKTSWAAPRIHYAANGGLWTTVPGVLMATSSDAAAFPPSAGWFKYDLPVSATTLEFVFNDGNGAWDNNKNANYKITAGGTYSVGGTAAITTTQPPSATAAPTRTPTPVTQPPPSATVAPTPRPSIPADLPNCDTFADSCSGLSYPSSTESRRWQTPPRNSSTWTAEYQDLRSLQGYAHVVYASDRKSATVTVRTYLRTAASCVYSFNGAAASSTATKTVDSTLTTALNVVIKCTPTSGPSEQWTLALDPINFVWQNTAVTQPTTMEGGQRGAIVDLVGWPYKDIESECSDFLGKAGYMGVKINPPQESVMSDVYTKEGQRNPWYLMYQPVSYRLFSRLGSRDDLRSMIQTCRKNGVRVYADAVINHMAAGGYDHNPTHRKPSGSTCSTWGAHSSIKGSPYYTRNNQFQYNKFTSQQPALEFPAVPYGPSDFHCERGISSYTDPYQLGNGWLVGLSDLDTSKTYVRERIAQYFVDLLGIGFSGFRIDAMKHIAPVDVAAIFGLFNKYMGGSLPADFISWGEILLGGEAGFLACDETNEYNFFKGLDKRYRAEGISETDIAKLKIWSSEYPNYHPTCGYWVLPAARFVVQNDDHDQQAPGSTSREMGDKGSVLIREKNVAKHRQFETQLFSRTDGDWKVKVVLSSYTFGTNGATGFPDGFSACGGATGVTCDSSMAYEKAFRAGSCGYTVENFASGKYTRVHRDLTIVNAMRTWLGGVGTVTNQDLGITGSC